MLGKRFGKQASYKLHSGHLTYCYSFQNSVAQSHHLVESLKPGVWVRVEYNSSRRQTYVYIGQIMNMSSEFARVKFLQKVDSERFKWPEENDYDDVDFEQIVEILREPQMDR